MNGTIVALGEILIRLKPPGHERFFQSPLLETACGGSEANVLASLSLLGLDARFLTALPPNPLGDGCVRYLRRLGVDTRFVLRRGERVGLYFFEAGASQRPSLVIYDRTGSAIASTPADAFDWNQIFDGASWFHISGITPAISARAAELSLAAVQEARARGLTISCDFNYRSKLWRYGRSPAEIMGALLRHVDVLVAGVHDAALLEIPLPQTEGLSPEEVLSQAWFQAFPNLRYHVTTHRIVFDANHHRLSARLARPGAIITSDEYDIPGIVVRVGSGDAFMAGLIYGLHTGMGEDETLAFAITAAALKHSIPGNVNLATAEEIMRLVKEGGSGRVQR